ELFADPAWDMLLDLLQAEIAQLRVPVSSLCIAAAVPATTALRWLKAMVAQGVFVRRADPHDGRRAFVELAPESSQARRRCFEAHAATLVGAAEALQQLADDGSSTHEVLQIIQDREHEADDLIREVLTEVRKTFLAPFDRGAITSLIGAMDDAIDEMLAAARA